MGWISRCGSSAVNLGVTSCRLAHTVPNRVFSGLLSIYLAFRNSSDENRLIVMEKSKLSNSLEQVFAVRGNLDYISSRYTRDTSGINKSPDPGSETASINFKQSNLDFNHFCRFCQSIVIKVKAVKDDLLSI